jgi:hypothetical protein
MVEIDANARYLLRFRRPSLQLSVTPDAGLVGQDGVIFSAEANPDHTRCHQARRYAARASSRSSRYRMNSLCPAHAPQGSGI